MHILFVVYDNDAHISTFPLGIAYLASVCRLAGHEVKIYSQDVYHWPETHLLELLDRERFDVIGVGVTGGYYQYGKLLKISQAVNASKNRPFFILGGHGPSPEPEFFLKKTGADAVVIGEGEETILELLDALQNKRGFSGIPGIALLRKAKLLQTPRRQPIMDIDTIALPAWDLFPMDHYALFRDPHIQNRQRFMSVLSSRGCSFKCNFCYRMDPGMRLRSSASIVEEIQILKKNYDISYIEFVDELFMSSQRRTRELCESFISANLGIKWCCSGRLNYAERKLLRLMKKAGCVFVNYGIESLDEKALRKMNKALCVKQIKTGIENTLKEGLSPGLNIIFGNIGETKESLQRGVDFLLKYSDYSQMRTIRPVTPYPGSELYHYAIKNGLLKDAEDFYENKHINSDLVSVNFTGLSDKEFHACLFKANKILLREYSRHKSSEQNAMLRKLYFEKDAAFRGFRHT